MRELRLAFLGFGGVGRAFLHMLNDKSGYLQREHGIAIKVVGVSDAHLGSLIDPTGIETASLLNLSRDPGVLEKLTAGRPEPANDRLIDESGADVLVEVSFTNPLDGEPARSYCLRAVHAGMHVVTSNKGPVVFGPTVLLESEHIGASFGFEGAVMSGTPVINFARECLPGATVRGFRGILNGTTNFMLGRMEDGVDFADAVAEAQRLGYAEADPTADLEGFDVVMKVVILARVLFGEELRPSHINRLGIVGIGPKQIADARTGGARWKLIGRGQRSADGTFLARVGPELVNPSDPLFGINGALNALCLSTDELGDVLVSGPGAGLKETAYALFTDLVGICSKHRRLAA